MKPMKLNKMSDIVGKPFAVLKEDILPTYVRWDETIRRYRIGRINSQTKEFEMYSNDVKQWVQIKWKREDNWKKQYMREIIFDQEQTFDRVWNPEKKAAGEEKLKHVVVPILQSVETQIQNKIKEEKARGTNPFEQFFVLNSKKTGPEAFNIEYTLLFEKPFTQDDIDFVKSITGGQEKLTEVKNPSSAGETPDLKLDLGAPSDPISPEELERQQALVNSVVENIKSRTAGIPPDQLPNYKNSIASQLTTFFEANKITYTTPLEVVDKFIITS